MSASPPSHTLQTQEWAGQLLKRRNTNSDYLRRDTAATFSLKFYRGTETVAKVPLADTSTAILGMASAKAAGGGSVPWARREGALAAEVTGFPRPEAQGGTPFCLQGQEN